MVLSSFAVWVPHVIKKEALNHFFVRERRLLTTQSTIYRLLSSLTMQFPSFPSMRRHHNNPGSISSLSMQQSWRHVTTQSRTFNSLVPRALAGPARVPRVTLRGLVFSGVLLAACTYRAALADTPETRREEARDDGPTGAYSQQKTSRQKEADNRKLSAKGLCLPTMGFDVDIPRDRTADVFLACHEHERNITTDGAAFCRRFGFEVAFSPDTGESRRTGRASGDNPGTSSEREGDSASHRWQREHGSDDDEEDDDMPCYNAPAVRPEENWHSRAVPLTWRLQLLLLWNQVKRYLQSLIPRPEIWLLLFFGFYFLSKICSSLKLLVGEATFGVHAPPGVMGSYSCGGSCEGEEETEGSNSARLTGYVSGTHDSPYPAPVSWAGRETMSTSQHAVLAAAEKRQRLNANRCSVQQRCGLASSRGGREPDSEDETESVCAEDAKEMMLVR
ncbi:folate receptor family protein [Cystoisospora suis]|uniref:Folate receptor family protein n=1 Tax=Cystoisospora suis TaxID=483139 RepID=A0A2C6KRN6_9APIC|nr:folate receptor family protein [Cystoisospora suis]